MKNIHVIQTDKPSNIVISTIDGKLKLNNNTNDNAEYHGKNQHIYITNDDEIKEDYVLAYGVVIKVMMFDNETQYFVNGTKAKRGDCKKIILTTDQDLIKDGVQKIDDEFLEWFVKNPSYEYVLITNDFEQINQDNPVLKGSTNLVLKYKITILEEKNKKSLMKISGGLEMGQIILKEEPKEETQSYICPKTNQNCDDEMCDSASNCNIDNSLITDSKEISFEEISNQFHQIANDFKHPFEEYEMKSCKTYSDNQETIPKQETAVEFLKFRYENNITLNQGDFQQAKEMEKQQKGYSEEEVLNIIDNYNETFKLDLILREDFNQWFEQFKKK